MHYLRVVYGRSQIVVRKDAISQVGMLILLCLATENNNSLEINFHIRPSSSTKVSDIYMERH